MQEHSMVQVLGGKAGKRWSKKELGSIQTEQHVFDGIDAGAGGHAGAHQRAGAGATETSRCQTVLKQGAQSAEMGKQTEKPG